MDVAAAIRAETNQLELQRKKKQQQQQQQQRDTTLHHSHHQQVVRNNPPPPPQKSRSFHDERNQFNPYAAQQQASNHNSSSSRLFPHYVNSEYQFENKDIACEDADSITSSLSGTLPGTIDNSTQQQHLNSPKRELQKLDLPKATVKAELEELRSSNNNLNNSNNNNNNTAQGETNRIVSSKSLPPPRRDPHGNNNNNNSYNSHSSGGVVNLAASTAKSVGSTGTRERITPGGNIIIMDTDNENDDHVDLAQVGSNNDDNIDNNNSTDDNANNDSNKDNNNNNSSTTTPAKSSRIEEIMTAYQGKVDTILKKRGDSFHSLVEQQNTDALPTTTNTTSANPNSSIHSSGTSNSGIENILDSYKKKVDEIMNSPTKPLPQSVAALSSSSSYASKPQQQPSLAVNFDKIEDDDDELSFQREGASDDRFVTRSGNNNSGNNNEEEEDRSYDSREGGTYSSDDNGDGDSHSHSSYGSGDSSRGSYEQQQQHEEDMIIDPPSHQEQRGRYSERANAILNSINGPQTNNTGDENTTRSGYEENDGVEMGGGSDADSYISGASSASEKSGMASLRRSIGEMKDGSANYASAAVSAAQSPTSSKMTFGRKDSLTRAQEITGLSPKKSKSLYQDGPTTGSLYRIELERRLAESTQREEEWKRENNLLAKNLREVQTQLDEVNTAARSNKYSSSEQASKIRELERKLKSEKERCNELERERDAIKEEYDQDLEEQKDINRQLEQMVMSEDFEKELEDEINQVKELEHANRRFKVKIDMLEREKNAIMKRYDGKMEDSTNKIKMLEEQQTEWEGKVGALESTNREMEVKWEAKLEEEKRYARELRFDLEKAEDKIKVLDAELEDLRDSNSKIEEYEQVLGKLMERNEELEEEVHALIEEKESMNRQDDLEEKRRALKVKELEQTIEEQQVYIEQQQETLDESVKTILKMYSLNNGQGDDMSTMTEEQLTGIARTMIPRASGRQTLPTVKDDAPLTPSVSTRGGASHLAVTSAPFSGGTLNRRRDSATTARGRSSNAFTDDVETLMLESETRVRARSRGRAHQQDDIDVADRPAARARSRGRPAPRQDEDFDVARARARSKSRGRGDRTESMRQLTERARTPGRTRSRSPVGYRRERDYDPSGPVSDSRALVLASPAADSGRKYGGQYDIPPQSGQRQSRRDVGGGKYESHDGRRSDRQRRSYHDNPRRGERDGDRRGPGGGGGIDQHRRKGGNDYPESRGYRNKTYSHNDDFYTPRRIPRDPETESDGPDRQPRVMSDGDDGRQWGGNNNRRRSSRRHHPRERDRDY